MLIHARSTGHGLKADRNIIIRNGVMDEERDANGRGNIERGERAVAMRTRDGEKGKSERNSPGFRSSTLRQYKMWQGGCDHMFLSTGGEFTSRGGVSLMLACKYSN